MTLPAEIQPDDLLQYGLAIVLGLIIGWERETSNKPAGWKTTTFVTLAGMLIMKLSLHMQQLGGEGSIGDPARLGAAALTGMGFLGAGVILQQRDRVLGLTTAASLWMMTAVGLAIGAGYYWHSTLVVLVMWVVFKADEWIDRLRGKQQDPSKRVSDPD